MLIIAIKFFLFQKIEIKKVKRLELIPSDSKGISSFKLLPQNTVL